MARIVILILLLCACTDLDSHSVVQIRMPGGVTSGFFVAPGIVVTVAHMASHHEGPIRIQYLNNDDEAQIVQATIMYVNYEKDRMLLRVRAKGEPVEVCEGKSGNLVKLWAWRENGPENTQGRIISHWQGVYYSKLDSEYGYSGGPVVVDGCVIGMHRGKNSVGWSYASDLNWLEKRIGE